MKFGWCSQPVPLTAGQGGNARTRLSYLEAGGAGGNREKLFVPEIPCASREQHTQSCRTQLPQLPGVPSKATRQNLGICPMETGWENWRYPAWRIGGSGETSEFLPVPEGAPGELERTMDKDME